MRYFAIIILLFIGLSASGQSNVKFPNGGSLMTQEQFKLYFNTWLNRVDKSTVAEISPVINPANGVGACVVNPAITSVYQIGKRSLKASISVNGTTSVNWRIFNNAAIEVRSGSAILYDGKIYIGWYADLPEGYYTLRIEGIQCLGIGTSVFQVIPEVVTPAPCTTSPTIGTISNVAVNKLTFTFSGLNVSEMIWSVKQSGVAFRTGSLTAGSTTTKTINFTELPAGNYQLELVGLGCTGVTIPKDFTITGGTTTPTIATRRVYYNFTGGGFDSNSPYGFEPLQLQRVEKLLNMSYSGYNFKGINGIRVNIKWAEYEPSEGTFRDDIIIQQIQYCIGKGIKYSVNLVPYLNDGDTRIPGNHRATLYDGNIYYTGSYVVPSMNSPIARSKFANTAKHLAQVMKLYADNVDYITTTTDPIEEFNHVYNQAGITGFSQADRDAWAISNPGVSYPVPDNANIGTWMQTTTGISFYNFITSGLRGFFESFSTAIHTVQGIRVMGMYDNPGDADDVKSFSQNIDKLFPSADIVYSSAGGAGTQNLKLLATDLSIGTYPGKSYAIDFDPEDVGSSQQVNPSYGSDLNGTFLLDYGKSFFNRGGSLIHLSGAYHPDKIPQLSQALYTLQSQYVLSGDGIVAVPETGLISPTVSIYNIIQPYRTDWTSSGGDLTHKVKIRLNPSTNPNP